MKKFALRLAAALLATGMILSMTACTSSGPESSVASETSTVSETVSSETSVNEDGTNITTGKYSSISDFVNSDLLQNQIESMKSAAAESGMEIEITGEGNKLIYTFVLSDDYSMSGKDVADKWLEEESENLENVAAAIKLAVEVENPVVVVRFVDTQGNEIAAREFTAG